jgi:Peptidase family M48
MSDFGAIPQGRRAGASRRQVTPTAASCCPRNGGTTASREVWRLFKGIVTTALIIGPVALGACAAAPNGPQANPAGQTELSADPGERQPQAIIGRLLVAALSDDDRRDFAARIAARDDCTPVAATGPADPKRGAALFRCSQLLLITPGMTPNASTDGRRIKISRGVLALAAGSEDELAFVLAHEMGHLVLGHSVFHGSIEKELDADSKGLEIMARAGYQPQGAIAILRRWAAFMPNAANGNDHPVVERRISRLEAQIATLRAPARQSTPEIAGKSPPWRPEDLAKPLIEGPLG